MELRNKLSAMLTDTFEKGPLDHFQCVIDTSKGGSSDRTYILPFASGTYTTLDGTTIKIYWGDGNKTTITNGVIDEPTMTHVYSTAGQYTIDITSSSKTMPKFSPYAHFTKNSNRLKIIECTGPIYKMVDTSGNEITAQAFRYCFQSCSNFKKICANFFKNNPNATTYAYQACFLGTAIEEVPAGLFDYTTKVTTRTFHTCFSGCSKLKTIPDDLFINVNKSATTNTWWQCFLNCSDLTINPKVFGTDKTRYSTMAFAVGNCFNRSSCTTANPGTAPDLWNFTFASVDHPTTFGGDGNLGLTNYAEIPADWK